MKYSLVIELNPPRSSLIVNGISTSCRPYRLQIKGPQAVVWNKFLRRRKYRNQFMGK